MGDFDRADPMDKTLLIMIIIFKQNLIYLPKIHENKLRNDVTWKRDNIGWESCPQVGSPVVKGTSLYKHFQDTFSHFLDID
jgi:hypothetical protein